MNKKILLGAILFVIIGVISFLGYQNYAKNKWVKDNWSDKSALNYTGDYEKIKLLLDYRDSLGAQTSKESLSEAFYVHLTESNFDSLQKYKIIELLISKGANINYCDKYGCAVRKFFRHYTDEIKDSLNITKLILSKGYSIKPQPQISYDNIDDCTFDPVESSNEVFDYVFNDYLKNKLTPEILECSAKSIILGYGVNDKSAKKHLERLEWLIKNGLNPNIKVTGVLVMPEASLEGFIKLPLISHLLYNHHFYKEDANKDKSRFLIGLLIEKGLDLKSEYPEVSPILLAEKSGDPELFKLIKSKFKN